MTKETEQKLINWENLDDDEDVCDLLHKHFSEYNQWDWCEISDEARRIYNLMFDENCENNSPLDGIWTAAAALAEKGAYAAIAAAIGIDTMALKLAVAPWYENQDDLPKPVSIEKFIELCEEETKYLSELHNKS
jgi:hypothetical protein